MSLYIEDTDRTADIKMRIAMNILNNVVPTILDDGEYIGKRISIAYTWSRFLCKIRDEECDDIPSELREWTITTIKTTADKLIDYAMRIIGKYVRA